MRLRRYVPEQACVCLTGTRQDERSADEVRAADEASPTEVRIGDAVYNGMGESFRSADLIHGRTRTHAPARMHPHACTLAPAHAFTASSCAASLALADWLPVN
jgi:hypothetical protein